MADAYKAYTTVKNGSTYEWREISSTGGGASPYDSIPEVDGTGSAGTTTLYSRGDHVHPSDTTKQDVLVDGVTIKTVNGESLLGSGNISVTSPTGGEANVIESMSVNGTSLPVSSKNVDIPLKTVYGQSVSGTGNIVATLETLTVGTQSYDGTADVTIPTQTTKEVDVTLTSSPQTVSLSTENTYCDSDIDVKVTPKEGSITLSGTADGESFTPNGATMAEGTGVGYYTSPIDSVKKNAPAVSIASNVKAKATVTEGWIKDDTESTVTTTSDVYLESVTMSANSGLVVYLPDGTTWHLECDASGNAYTY